MKRPRARKVAVFTAAALLPLAALIPASASTSNSRANSTDNDGLRVGYFTEWGIYGANFPVQRLEANGAASMLTHINYAFINVAPEMDANGQPILGSPIECRLADPWADYQKPFPAADNVTGKDDPAGQELYGNFNQLRELKKKHKGLKVLASLGGYSFSSYFSDASLTKASRQHLVDSCVNLLIKGNIPGLQAGAAKGVFDGIDLDWEYPGAPGMAATTPAPWNTPTFRPADTQNFTALVKDFRRALDKAGAQTPKQKRVHYQLTAALPAAPSKIDLMQVRDVVRTLDFANIMTYDLHGPWEATGPTDFQSGLFMSPDSPQPANNQFSVDTTMRYYLSKGADRGRLVVGVPFYGHGWQGVPDGGTHGLYQSATGPNAALSALSVAGTPIWKDVQALGWTPYRDPITKGYWVYNPDVDGGTFIGIDDPVEIGEKMKYVQKMRFAGAMVWSLDQDDTSSALMHAVDLGLSEH